MVRIAILTPTYTQFSGIDRVVELQAERLIDEGNEVVIYTLQKGMESKRAKVVEIGMPRSLFVQRILRLFYYFNWIDIAVYSEFMKDYDLVISHLYPMNLIALKAKKKYGVKYIYHNHGVATPSLFSSFVERTYMKYFNYLSNKTSREADEVVSISDYLRKQYLEENGIDSRIEYDPIDTSRFKKGVNGDKIRKKFNIALDEKVCLFVGRLSPHKGVDLLIEAFNYVVFKNDKVKLLIVGKDTFDDYYNKLKMLAKRGDENKVIFAGFVPDEELPDYYGACDVYTTATQWEGFDMPIAEAYACGKPSVAFDIGPHPEVLKKGKLVPNKDVKAFADAILDLIQ